VNALFASQDYFVCQLAGWLADGMPCIALFAAPAPGAPGISSPSEGPLQAKPHISEALGTFCPSGHVHVSFERTLSLSLRVQLQYLAEAI
jgi:hypothetical protein